MPTTITRKGLIRVHRDGVLVSEHAEEPKAFEAALAHAEANGGGTYRISYPEREVKVITHRPIGVPSTPQLGTVSASSSTALLVPLAIASSSPIALAEYVLEIAADAGGPWTEIARGLTIFGSSGYPATGLSAETEYFFRTRAIDTTGRTSLDSAVASGTTEAVGALNLFQNWPNARGAYLQSPSSGSNGLDNAAIRPKLARLDVWIQQPRYWMRSTDAASFAAVKAIRDVPLWAYYDPRFTAAADLTSDPPGGGTLNYAASQSAGAPAHWRARNAAGDLLGFNNTSQPAFTPASQVAGTNTAGRSFAGEVWNRLMTELESGGGINRLQYFIGGLIDDQQIENLNFLRLSDGVTSLCDFDGNGVNDDPSVYTDSNSGGSRVLAGIAFNVSEMRAVFGSGFMVGINTDAPYKQLDASTQPRPLSGTALAGIQDIGKVENILETNLGMTRGGVLLSYYILPRFFQCIVISNQMVRDDATSLMGKRMTLLDQEFDTAEEGTPTAPVLLAMRLMWGLGMLVEGAFYGGDCGGNKAPAELDECNLKLGDPVGTRSMGTHNVSSGGDTFTIRARDLANGSAGSGDVHYAEFAHGIVLVRTDKAGLSTGSTLGDGSALSFTLPSAGSGYRWDEFNAATYAHPDIAAYVCAGQDTSLNGGATNVTTVSLKPLHVKALLRVAA